MLLFYIMIFVLSEYYGFQMLLLLEKEQGVDKLSRLHVEAQLEDSTQIRKEKQKKLRTFLQDQYTFPCFPLVGSGH